MGIPDNGYAMRLKSVASRLRASGSLGRSQPLVRLFDYLLERSLAGHVPKEIEIAQAVFAKDTDFDIMQDASVRVYIHRLRRKLDEFNTRRAPEDDLILLPLGEYQLTVTGGAIEPEHPACEAPVAAPHSPTAASPRLGRFALMLAAILALNLVGWLAYIDVRTVSPIGAAASAPLWRKITDSSRPTFIFTGDYYVFGDAPDTFNVTRLVRDFAINSGDDLEIFKMANPEAHNHYLNLDLHYLPVSIGPALRELLPILTEASPPATPPLVTQMSQASGEMLKNANIVYVGFLSGLGFLRDPLFQASQFEIGENFDELIDKPSGRRFDSDWGVVADGKVPQRDYAYIASIPGPTGQRIIIVAGTRDAAVVQAAQTVVDPRQLDLIMQRAKGDSFEALYEVRTINDVNLGSSLVIARAIKGNDIWLPNNGRPR